MPYKPLTAAYRHGRSDLVDLLVQELDAPQPEGTVGAPEIIEQAQRFTDRLHVYVIWDKWVDVPDANRGAVILDAYEKSKMGREKAMKIAIAMGVTPAEAKNLGIG